MMRNIYRIIIAVVCAALCGFILGCSEPNLNDGGKNEIEYIIDVYGSDNVKILEKNYVIEGEEVFIIFQRVGAQEFTGKIEYEVYFDEAVIKNGEIFDIHGAETPTSTTPTSTTPTSTSTLTTTTTSLSIPQDDNADDGYILIVLYEIRDESRIEVESIRLNVVDLESDAFYTIEASQYILAEGGDVEITFRRKGVVPDVVSYKIEGSIEELLSDEKMIFHGTETTTTIRLNIPQDDDADNEYIIITLHKTEDESSTEIKRGIVQVIDDEVADCRADVYTKCEMGRELIDDGNVQYGKNNYAQYRMGERQGNLAHSLDEDWFKVKLASGLQYRIEVETTTPQELAENLAVFLVDNRTDKKLNALSDKNLVNLGLKSSALVAVPTWTSTYWLQVRAARNQDVKGDYAVTITQASPCTKDRDLISHYHLIQSDNHIENFIRDGLCEATVGDEERWKIVRNPAERRSQINGHYVYLESNTNYIITADASINTDSQERSIVVHFFDGYGNHIGSGDRIGDVETIKYRTGMISQGAPPFHIQVFLRNPLGRDWITYGDYTLVVTKEE